MTGSSSGGCNPGVRWWQDFVFRYLAPTFARRVFFPAFLRAAGLRVAVLFPLVVAAATILLRGFRLAVVPLRRVFRVAFFALRFVVADVPASSATACAAARRAIGTRNGEQET